LKLLDELQKQIGAMAELRYAWFTSLNTDIEFVETYVLPATLGANTPRNRLEYEQLQQEVTDKRIDFRVFCDPRFLDTNRVKRTCIPIHGIRPVRAPEWFSEASLFHPKVIYLEDKNRKRVIGAGSANLTLSGWGRNLEAFRFFEVTTQANYRSIREFFEQLCFAADIQCDLAAQGKFIGMGEKWNFVHSYQKRSFPIQLLADASNKDLAVWSPYLSRDLANFIDRLQAASGSDSLRVHLVPDRIEGKFLRTQWNDEVSQMKEDGRISFYANPLARHPNTELCHAKLWKLPGKLAVGSWNFTGPGSNSLVDEEGNWSRHNNVEAGFIIKDNHNWLEACGDVLNVGSSDCASAELLDQESLVAEVLPPFDLHVSFDWHATAYMFDGKWLDRGPRDGYSVQLPGVVDAVPLAWSNQRLPIQPGQLTVDDKMLLRDRVFRVFRGEKEIQRALISELNARSRRAQSFETLQDLLETFVHGDDPRSLHDLPFRIPLETDTFADDNVVGEGDFATPLVSDSSARGGISYFRLFHAMYAYQQKLADFAKLEQLDSQVFSWPGCILELVEKVAEKRKESGHEIFNWFLANEVHSLCEFARSRRRSLIRGANEREPGYTSVPLARWQELSFEMPAPPKGVSLEYSKLVSKQYNHD
jgi:hypothetical protein